MTTARLSWLDAEFGPAVPRFEDADLPKRPTVEYTGAGVTVTDDTVNNRTIVDVATGGDGSITGDSVEWEPEASPDMASKTYANVRNTTDDTETTALALDALPDETFGDYTATVLGRSEDDRQFRLDLRAAWEQTDGTVAEVDAPNSDPDSEPTTGNPAGWDAFFDISTATPRVRVTGEADVAIRWSVIATSQTVGLTATPPEPSAVPDSWDLSAYFEAPYAGSPWEGTASAGDSDTHDATEGTDAPAISISPPNIADFNGTDDLLTLDGTAADYYTSLAYSGWALVFIDAISTDSGTATLNVPILTTDAAGYFGVFLASTGPTATVYHNGILAEGTASATFTLGQWALIQWRYDGTDLSLRVNSGAWDTNAVDEARAVGMAQELVMGKNFSLSAWLDGKVRNFGLLKTYKSDSDFDDLVDAMNTKYSLSL